MNKVILMGRLTANPECKQTQGGKMYCRFQIAINRPKQQDGTQQADFISCVAWGKTAETISQYFIKGKLIIVEGSLHNNNYTDKNNVQHYGLDVWLDKFDFVLSDNSQNQQPNGYQQVPQGQYYKQPVATSYQPQNTYPQQQYPQTQPQAPRQQTPLPNENINQSFEQPIPDGSVPF